VTRPVDAVIEFLEAEKARGVSHVFLDECARDGLRELYRRAQSGGVTRPAQPAAATGGPASSAGRIEMPAITAKPVLPAVSSKITTEGNSKQERLDSLRRQAETWAPARSLGTLRDIMVFATGHPEARVMLVG
jgi:DNA polymerase